ncbi:hypothetical protein V1460_00445 [Streptomyces sp. SCSIO 30461]
MFITPFRRVGHNVSLTAVRPHSHTDAPFADLTDNVIVRIFGIPK